MPLRSTMKRFFAARFSRGVLFLLPLFAFAVPASTRARAADAPQNVESQIERGRVLLGLGEARAAEVLQDAARASLNDLQSVSRTEPTGENAPDVPLPRFAMPLESSMRARWRRARLAALEAHRWLAQAQLARREDEGAIAALATELQLAKLENESTNDANASGENSPSQEASAQLQTLLQNGASRATMPTLQRLARFFYEVAPPQLEDFTLPLSSQKVSQRVAFLDAPLAPRGENEAASTRAAPLYRAYAKAALPSPLQMDRAVFAYRAEDETHWKLIARVFYASPSRTQNHRDDAPRARFLASRFVKIAALQRALWGLENRETTSIWLLEKGADWPQESEAANEDGAQNFRAGGWIEDAPSDIFLFRAAVPRSDFGWTRQLMHEYSHVVWPRFGGFAPPLEPFAAGLFGETLMALQLAQPDIARVFCDEKNPDFSAAAKLSSAAETREVSADEAAPISDIVAEFLTAARVHVESNALPALRLWNARGPRFSAHQKDAESLRWTQGLAVSIERASGDETLSQVLQEAKRREYSQQKIAAPTLLLSCYESVLRAQWKAKAQLAFRFSSDETDDFPNDEMPPAKAGARFSNWIYLPPRATSLEVAWRPATPQKAPPQLRLWLDGRETKPQIATKTSEVFISRLALEKRDGGWRKLETQAANAQPTAATIRE